MERIFVQRWNFVEELSEIVKHSPLNAIVDGLKGDNQIISLAKQ